jgi:hypothetical protein
MTTTETKTRTITLTDRAPVRIIEDQWPTIAQASGDSYGGNDYNKHQQSLSQNEVDQYTLKVRRHMDGRVLVYGILQAANGGWHAPAEGEDFRGGELLQQWDMDVVLSIRRVGEYCHLPDRIIRECIADLPAVEL